MGMGRPALLAVTVVGAIACAPQEPKSPVPLDESASLVGVDADEDGVRDDVEEVIDAMPVTQALKDHLRIYAEIQQRIMAADFSGDEGTAKALAYELAQETFRTDDCLPDGVDQQEFREKRDAVTLIILNTDERNEQDAMLSHLIDGRDFPSADCGSEP